MIDAIKIAQYTLEMAEHADGAAQYLSALFGGKYVTKVQAHDMANYVLAQTKRNIENCPFASQEEKETEIHRREFLMNILKLQMGL